MKFSIKEFFSKCDQIRRKLRILVTFTEEILNGKLHFLRNAVKMENGTGILQKGIIDAIYSIRKSSKRPDINSISKALVKDNATNIDIHSVEK